MMHRLLLLFVITTTAVSSLQAQRVLPAHGEATRAALNGKDIHHPRNDELRQVLMQDAVRDAVEQVAGVQVSVVTELGVQERRGTEQTFFVEDLRTSTVQRVGIRWTRNAPFTFAPHPTLKRTWICSVSGTVQEFALGPTGGSLNAVPYSEVGVVKHKRGAQVTISPSAGDVFHPGDRIELFGSERSAHGRTADALMTRPTASVYVTSVQDGQVNGTVIRGRWKVRAGQRAEPGDFPLLRGGVKVQYTLWAPPPSPTTEQPFGPVTSGLSIGFFEQSLVQHWGATFGIEVATTSVSPTENVMDLYPHLGVFRPFAILPEVLQLSPSLSGGMALLGTTHADGVRGLPFFLDLGLSAELRLGALDLSAGLRNRSVLGAPQLGGLGPFLGLQLDLYRLTNDTEDRITPGFGRGIRALREAGAAVGGGGR